MAPTAGGGTNWWSPAYSPRTGLLYVNAFDGEGQFFVRDEQYGAGERYTGGDVNANPMAYQPVVEVPAAFERRCIPPDGVVRRLHIPNMRPPHALSGGRLAALGATRGSTTGCYTVGGAQYVTMAVGNRLHVRPARVGRPGTPPPATTRTP